MNGDVAYVRAFAREISNGDKLMEESLLGFCEDIEKLRAELEALKAAHQWQPIETAPKDGTLFLAWCPSAHGLPAMFSLCAWHKDAGFCVDELRYPTVWMPLPPTDSGSAESSEGGVG